MKDVLDALSDENENWCGDASCATSLDEILAENLDHVDAVVRDCELDALPKKYTKLLTLFEDADKVDALRPRAARGDAEAQCDLADYLFKGEGGLDRDDAEAVRLYRLAADQGLAKAQNYLGRMYEQGRGVARDDAEAARLYRLAADQGNAKAQHCLGCMYSQGRGVARDDTEAARLYRLAADQSHAEAQSDLAWMYEHGRGVARDDAEAVRLYRLAADQGLKSAESGLGRMWADCRFSDLRAPRFAQVYGHIEARDRRKRMKDEEDARRYRLAADQGDVEAQYILGCWYRLGCGVARDDAEAARLHRLAADQGHADAQHDLGLMYQGGSGVALDYAEAARLYPLAADQGHARAQCSLGCMYEHGRGVARDDAEAVRLYLLAAGKFTTCYTAARESINRMKSKGRCDQQLAVPEFPRYS